MNTAAPAAPAAPSRFAAPDSGTQYVTLGIGDEVFALPVDQVREVIDLCPFTRVPNAPRALRGMIDVRGRGVPVIDMRQKLGLCPAEPTPHTRIVVMDASLDGRSLVIGALTDRVYEVTVLDDCGTEPPPDIGVGWDSGFIRGIGRRGAGFVIILDLARVLSSDEVALLGAA